MRMVDRVEADGCLFVCFDSLHPINNLSVIKGQGFLGLTSTTLGLMCLAQGHNAVTLLRLKPVAPQSRVKHSTTELLRTLMVVVSGICFDGLSRSKFEPPHKKICLHHHTMRALIC